MKATTTILAAILILQINTVFASNDGVPVNTNKGMSYNAQFLLAPSTPAEATFEETAPAVEVFVLSPVTPKEATFEEETEDPGISNLAPVTPAEADFNNDEPALNNNMVSLVPVTPAEADFPELP
jgi:hypothetical protein